MAVEDLPELSPMTASSREELAAALTHLRERRGMTVRDVAQAAGLPLATAGGYFSGRHLPPLAAVDQFVRVLTVLDVPEVETAFWVAAIGRLRRQPGRRPATAPAPYRGLAAYQPEDAALFFGREALTQTLVARVVAKPATPLVVIGSSGSGKSSLLRAGLAATLIADGRQVVVVTPGDDPNAALAAAIAGSGRGVGGVLIVDQFEELFAAGHTPSASAFVEALATIHRAGVVVVLGVRADFFDRILGVELLTTWLTENSVLVGPMSADALRRVVVEPARVVGVEVEDALVEVLVAEATAGSRSTHGSGLETGVLPLLSHVLFASWLAASGRRLTLAQYREAGGFAGSIAQTAEEVYDRLTDEQRAVAGRTLSRLVHVRDGAADTRRMAVPREFGSALAMEVVTACVDARLLIADQGHIQIAHEALLTAWPRFRSWLDADRDGLRTHSRLTEAVQRWLISGRDPDLMYRGSELETAVAWTSDPDQRGGLEAAEVAFLHASSAAEHQRASARRRTARRLRVLAAGLAVLTATTGGFAAAALAQKRQASYERDLAVSRQLAVTAQTLAGTDPALAGQVAAAAYLTADTLEARTALLSASGRTVVSRLAQATGIVNALDVSPEGSMVAAGTDAGSIAVWSTGTDPHELAAIPVPDAAVYSVTFSPDGQILASGGDSGRLSLWRLSDPENPVPMDVQGAEVGTTLYGLTFSADGATLAAAVADGTVHLWQQDTPADGFTLVAVLPAFEGTAQAVAMDPSGTLLATAGSEGLLSLWDVSDPAHVDRLSRDVSAADGQITSLDISPDGHTLAAGATDALVHLWDISDPAEPIAGLVLTGPASWVNGVSFSSDGSLLAAPSSDQHLWIWRTGTGAVTQALVHPTTLLSARWSPSGERLYSGGADGVVREWTYPGSTLSGFTSIAGQGVFGADLVVTATADGIHVWDASDPDAVTQLSLTPPPDGARLDGAVDISDVLGLVVAGDTSGALHFWDIADPGDPTYLTSVQAHSDWVDSISFDASGTRMAASSDDTSISLWDLSGGIPDAPTSRLDDLGGFVYAAAFSPDARTLVASVLDGQVLMVDVSDLTDPHLLGEPLTGPIGYVYSAGFSPDGRTIAASGNDKTIWLWDVTDPARPTPLGAPLVWADGYATNLAFSPDGSLLAAAMTDGTVRLWDLADRQHPARWASLAGITGTVYGLEFSPDGRHLSAAGADRTVRIWNTSLTEANAEICASADRGLAMSQDEWARIAGDLELPALCR